MFFGPLFAKTKLMGLRNHSFCVKAIGLLILFTALSLFASSPIQASGLNCQKLFDSTAQASPFLPIDLSYKEGRSKEQTVVTGETVKDKDGNSLLILEKTGELWDSSYTPVRDNYQGDPRWFGMLFGPQVSYHFGFRKLADNMITAPTAKTFNAKITEFNKKLRDIKEEPIGLRVHEAKPSVEEGIEYLKNVYENNSLPLASSGHYAVHDLSYHLMAILTPKNVIDGVKSRIGVLLRLKEKLDRDAKLSKLDRYVLEDAVNTLVNRMVKDIDVGTGNIGLIILLKRFEQLNSRSKPYGATDFKTLVLDYIVRDTQQVIEIIDKTVEVNFVYRLLKRYASADLKDFFDEGLSPKDKELIVQQTGKVVTDFIAEFLHLEQKNIEASRQEVSVEDTMTFIEDRVELFNSLIP